MVQGVEEAHAALKALAAARMATSDPAERHSFNVRIARAKKELKAAKLRAAANDDPSRLPIVAVIEAGDRVITCRRLPEFCGSEDGDLGCGGCGRAVGRRISAATLQAKYSGPQRVLVRCVCGCLNVLPTRRAVLTNEALRRHGS